MGRIMILIILLSFVSLAWSTVDINMAELEYISNHISQSECRRLVAALHTDSYELDPMIVQTGFLLPDTTPCIELLIHWNSSPGEGRGKTHQMITRRLRQLGHRDLATWLSKTVFKQLSEKLEELGLERSRCKCKRHRHKTTTVQPQRRCTTEVLQDIQQEVEQQWLPFDSILLTIIGSLLAIVIVFSIFLCVKLILSHMRNRGTNSYKYEPMNTS